MNQEHKSFLIIDACGVNKNTKKKKLIIEDWRKNTKSKKTK